MNIKLLIMITATSALTVVFGCFVWPTQYRNSYLRSGGSSCPVRIDRFSGHAEILTGSGWRPLGGGNDAAKTRKEEELPPEEASKITGNAVLSYGSLFSGKIYNGSAWVVSKVIVNISAKEKDGTIRWSRDFAEPVTILSLSTGTISISVTDGNGIQDAPWSMKKVYGYRE